jgi:hypothetical protein
VSFQTLQNAVSRIAPNLVTANAKDPSNIGGIVNSAYQQVMRSKDWMACVKQYVHTMKGVYQSGTVSMTAGSASVTGLGTAWTSDMAGEFLRIGNEPYYRIESVSNATTLLLSWAYDGASQSGAGYAIADMRIQLPGDCEYVKSVASQYWPMARTDSALLDVSDPLRLIYGIPLCYAECGPSNGKYEIELWPVCNTSTGHAVTYRAGIPDMVNGSDMPIMPEAGPAIEKLAQAEACGVLASRTESPIWLQLGQGYMAAYRELLLKLEREDRRKQGSSPVAMDSEDIPNWSDPNWVAAYRQLAAYSTWRLA